MKRGLLTRASQAVQLLGGVLCAVLGLRLMTLAIGDAQAQRAPVASASNDPPAAAGAATAQPSRGSARRQRAPAPERRSSSAPSLRLTLSVAGPERSEVYVNGSRLGTSPYLGDYTCKQGEELRIEIVPTEQALITRSAICEGRTLWIR